MTITFKKAERKAKPMKLGMAGASGSGKTYSALLLARGLAGPDGRIAVIDTESGASNFYDALTDFDVAALKVPASGQDYIDAMQAALDAGYDVVIIDCITHDWEKVIDHESDLPSKNMNTWHQAKKNTGHSSFFEYLFAYPIDVICTVRSEQAFEIVKGADGKVTKKKLGLRPRQQPNFEYDFDLIFDIESDTHIATPGGLGKNRTPIWQGDKFVITEKHGQILREWRDAGSEWVEPMRHRTQREIERYIKSLGWRKLYKEELLKHGYDKPFAEMSEVEAQKLLTFLTERLSEKETKQK
jgi:hypothetical protein